MAEDKEFQKRIVRIEVLIQAMESLADPTARAAAKELVRSLLELHGVGLSKILAFATDAGAPGRAILDDMTRDGLVGSLLLLHGLHPVDLETRVKQALEKVRLARHPPEQEAEILLVAGDVVRLRLHNPSAKRAIEAAVVEAAPDVVSLEIEDLADEGTTRVSLPIVQLGAMR